MARRSPQFDMCIWQVVPWPILRDNARYLEGLLDANTLGTLWLSDTYAWGGPVLEAWTTLAALATCTEKVRLGTLVTSVALRHPAMLAKQAATVDCISGGRLDLGIGAGDNLPEEVDALGLPSLSRGAMTDRLGEAVHVVDQLLRDRQLTFQGEYYKLDKAVLVPEPVQRPRPPLAVAAQGRKGIRIAAEYADIWVTLPSGETQEEALMSIIDRGRLLDEACNETGRDPEALERACLAGWGGPDTPFASSGAFDDFVGRYRAAGIQRFIFMFGNEHLPEPYREWISSGAWATRESLEAFAAQEMVRLRGGEGGG